ncbi:MAG: Ig-like domain-containing protein [Pseudorhodobacter sp.]
MVKAIDFAIRAGTGGIVRGGVAGEGGSEFLKIGSGEAVSLNLPQSSVLAYERQGKDLVLKLTDGRGIVLSGFFEADPGQENRLYLSTNGEIVEVYLTDAGNGRMYASYGPADTWNKYSQLDSLRFVEDNTLVAAEAYSDDNVGMGAFVPGLLGLGGSGLGTAAAIVGGAAVIGGIGGGGGGGGGGQPTRAVPTVDEPEKSSNLTTNTEDPKVIVSGTGEPGDTVTVTVGDKEQTTTIHENGTWKVEFADDDFPEDGTHEAEVVVTGPGFGPEELDGPTFVIDMTPPDVSVTEGTQSVGHIENLEDHANGVTIAGEGEVGARIEVKVGEHTLTTTVSESGSWSVTFTQSQVQGGEYTIPVTVTATDGMGNRTVVTDVLDIDTVPHPLTFNPVTGDDMINGTEAAGAVTVTGQTTAGASVTVTMEGASQTVTAGSNGNWSVTYAAGTFQTGDFDRTFTATTVDRAGNTTVTTHTVIVDTTTSVTFSTDLIAGDDVVNNAEAGGPITFTGQAEAGSTSVNVEWNGTTLPATVSASGAWTVTFPAGTAPVANGPTTATVTATDRAGNTASDTRTFQIDRSTNVAVDAGQAGGDNVISAVEANQGITLTGTAEAGARVEVTFQSVTRTVTATAEGTWSAEFTSSEIQRGTFDSQMVTVRSTDLAGNVATASHSLKIDTEVLDFAVTSRSTGADNVLNEVEAQQGLTVTGTVEAGATSVAVTFGDAGPYAATITGTTWSLTIPKSAIPQGETSVQMTAVATDRYGNVSEPLREMVEIDRIVDPFTRSGGQIGGDGMLNAAEVASGLTLNGTAEAGSTVVVQLSNGASRTVSVGAGETWTVRFEPGDLPRGEGGPALQIQMTATDRAGNVATFTESVIVDTVAPGAPEVLGFSKIGNLVDGIRTEATDDSYEFVRVDGNGNAVTIGSEDGPYRGNPAITEFEFDKTVPDGSYLVINTQDAAGNASSTLLIVDNTTSSTVDLSRAGLAQFDLSAIDLSWAPDAHLTISADQLIAMTGADNRLVVKGDSDDRVTINGPATAGGSEVIDGQTYTVYTLGSNGATLLLDDDIQTVI